MQRVIAIAAALLAATAAIAQPGQPPDRPGGRLNLFISPSGEPFRGEPGTAYPVAAWFTKADADGDGGLTLAEFEADALRFLAALDANKDGRINGVETQTYETEVVPEILPRVRPMAADVPFEERMKRRRKGGGPGGSPGAAARRKGKTGPAAPQGAALYALLNEPQPVAAADADFNTVITREEWTRAAQRRFVRLDVNGDRVVRFDELPKTPVQQLAEEADTRDEPRRRWF